MLKGINIRGERRLEYLDFLPNVQDENIENLENFYEEENQNINNKIELNERIGDNLVNNNEKNVQENYNLICKFNFKKQKKEEKKNIMN